LLISDSFSFGSVLIFGFFGICCSGKKRIAQFRFLMGAANADA
jgi:hypothetical protein